MNKRLLRKNFAHNSIADSDPSSSTHNRLVNDQNGATGSLFEYGAFHASWNACEAIAVHNAKVLNGLESSLSDAIKAFQSAGAMLLRGALGSNPYAIGRVLKNEGLECERVRLSEITNKGTYIISFWNSKAPWRGLHTVALSGNGRTLTAYNLRGDGKSCPIALSDYARHYICGYRIK